MTTQTLIFALAGCVALTFAFDPPASRFGTEEVEQTVDYAAPLDPPETKTATFAVG